MGFLRELEAANENGDNSQSPFAMVSAKKILGERNADETSIWDTTPREKLDMGLDRARESKDVPLKPRSISGSSCSVGYDPVTNYTSPRPEFLRYNPDRRKEILLRMRDEERATEDDSASASASPAPLKLSSQEREDQEDAEDGEISEVDDGEEGEVEERRPWCSRMEWKLLLLLGVFLFFLHCLFPMNYHPSGALEDDAPSTGNFWYQNLLIFRAGLSDVCLDIGEDMCGIQGPGSDLVVSKDDVFFDSDEVDVVHESDGKESTDEIELVGERDEALMDEDDVQDGEEESVVEKGSEEQEMRSQSEERGGREIGGESVEATGDQAVTSDEMEEIEDEEGFELAESLVGLEFQSAFSSLQEDQAAEEEFELQAVPLTPAMWKLGHGFAFEDCQLLFLSVSLSAVVISLLSSLLRYFLRSHQNSSPISSSSPSPSPSSSPSFLPSNKLIDETKIVSDTNVNFLESNHSSTEQKQPLPVPAGPMTDELRVGVKDSTTDEFKGFYETRQPIVELLGEFSISDALSSRSAPGKALKSERLAESEFTRSGSRMVPLESQSERSRTLKVKLSSSSSSKVHPYDAAESNSHTGYAARQKRAKQEDTAGKGEAKPVVTVTPVRRSSRLQNRVASPTP